MVDSYSPFTVLLVNFYRLFPFIPVAHDVGTFCCDIAPCWRCWGEWNCPKNSSTRRNGGQLANGRPFIILVAPILVKFFLLLDFWLFAMCDLGRDGWFWREKYCVSIYLKLFNYSFTYFLNVFFFFHLQVLTFRFLNLHDRLNEK
jgi:hypothetical protein